MRLETGLSPAVKYFTDHSGAMWILFFSVLWLLCLCARLFNCALWSPAGKGLTYWLSFVVSGCDLVTFPLYPGSSAVLDCIDSLSLHPYLLYLLIYLQVDQYSKIMTFIRDVTYIT